MSNKAVVLSSGGIDSTTCLAIAIRDLGKDNVSAVSVSYGQKHTKEIDCAKKIAEHYGIAHYDLDLSNVMKYSNCSLLSHSTEDIPKESYAEQLSKRDGHPVTTYVPFRNGLMLSAVASFALSIYPDEDVDIYLGNHADDAAGNAYPDCSKDFTDTMRKAIELGTDNMIHVVAPLAELNKARVVKEGLELDAPYHLTWSCYEGKDTQCGKCGTCVDRINAFKLNHAIDPVQYAIEIDWEK